MSLQEPNVHEVILRCRKILSDEGFDDLAAQPLSTANFEKFAQQTAYVLRQWPKYKQDAFASWLVPFSQQLRVVYDDFARLCELDPMIRYMPAHDVAARFHKSKAPRRYFRAGNRCSKTQTAYAEHYYVVTAQHPYRRIDPKDRNSTAIVAGLPFNKYAPDIFEKKLFEMEENNPLAPMFPENGRWFCHYDVKNRIFTVACPECAAKNRGKLCPSHHARQTISLMNTENGLGVFEAFVVRMGHIDEHIEEKFYQAFKQRLASAKGSFMLITGTPLHGDESWETLLLAEVATNKSEMPNLADPEDPHSGPLVEMFEIDQFAAGIVPHHVIRQNMMDMDKAEIDARVYGRPTPLADHPVFDRQKLSAWKDAAVTPKLYTIDVAVDEKTKQPKDLLLVSSAKDLVVEEFEGLPASATGVRIWEMPQKNAQYIMGIDVAAGLAPQQRAGKKADASACSVLKLTLDPATLTIKASLVAQYWGYINPLDYALEVFKLGTFYNHALAIVEITGGHGNALMIELKDRIGYQALYRPPVKAEMANTGSLEARFGVETQANSKPTMVAALQRYINRNLLTVQCWQTLNELSYFEQITKSASGAELTAPKYRGAGGAKDDRVMSLAIAIGTLVANPLIFDFTGNSDTITKPAAVENEEVERDLFNEMFGGSEQY